VRRPNIETVLCIWQGLVIMRVQTDEGTSETEHVSTEERITVMEERTRGLERTHVTSEKCVM
jgi:hypothetical protein